MKNVLVSVFLGCMMATALGLAIMAIPAGAWSSWSVLRGLPAFYAMLGCVLIALATGILYYKNTDYTRCGVAFLCSLLLHGLIFCHLNTIHIGRLDIPEEREAVLNIRTEEPEPVTVKEYVYYWNTKDAWGEEESENSDGGFPKPELDPEIAPAPDLESALSSLPPVSSGETASIEETEAMAHDIEVSPLESEVADLTTNESWQDTVPVLPPLDPAQVLPQALPRTEGVTLTEEEQIPQSRVQIKATPVPNLKKIDLRESSRRSESPSRTVVKPAEPQPGKLLPGEQQQWGEIALQGTPQGTSQTSEKVLAGTGEEDAPAGTQYTVASRNDTTRKRDGVVPREDARLSKGGQSTGAVAMRPKEQSHEEYLSGAFNGVSDRVLENVTKVQEISGSNLPGEAHREQLITDIATARFEDEEAIEVGNLPTDVEDNLPMSDEEWKEEMKTVLADRRDLSGMDDIESVAITVSPTPSYRQRRRAGHRAAIVEAGGNPEAEDMVERGLEFMKRTQFADGHWSFDHFSGSLPSREMAEKMKGSTNSDTAATGLGLLVFLGYGQTHVQDPQNPADYHDVVHRGIQWLVKYQQPDGALFSERNDANRYSRIYAHGIATIAMCEAYGMTRDPRLREPAQRAVNFIVHAQSNKGGWRYTPEKPGGPWRDGSDTSVSGWQLMALVSAKRSGLDVPDSALEKAKNWINSASINKGARFCYLPLSNPKTAEQRGWPIPSPAMTAEGLLMELYLNYRVGTPEFQQGVDYLAEHLPTFDKSRRDAYYWYYATQVMFHVRGPRWDAWQNQLVGQLQANQEKDDPYLAGSWDFAQDKWGSHGGRHYTTAMHLLTLEVYYRHLPLFKSLRPDEVAEDK